MEGRSSHTNSSWEFGFIVPRSVATIPRVPDGVLSVCSFFSIRISSYSPIFNLGTNLGSKGSRAVFRFRTNLWRYAAILNAYAYFCLIFQGMVATAVNVS